MSLAANLKKRTEEVLAMRRDGKTQEAQRRGDAETEVQSRVFERAREVFDKCLCAARVSVEKRADLAVLVELASGRFDRADFSRHMNCWQMAVLALQENGFEAQFEFTESEEPHELAGGTATVYTPCIYFSWHQ
ncbi:MAG: hypothetical protein AAB375_02410 [Patescibacteria group bacterium]